MRKKKILIPLFAILLIITITVSAFDTFIVAVLSIVQNEEQQGGTSEDVSLDGLPSFITQEMVVAAIRIQREYGYPVSVCLAQIIAESGFGRYGPGGEEGKGLSKLAYNYKNLFGIKGRGPAGSVNMSTGEQTSSGQDYTITAGFRVYNSYTECIEDRAGILSRVYADLIDGVTDAFTFARKIAGRWATSINYGNTLVNLINRYDLLRFDSMSEGDITASGSTGGGSGGSSTLANATPKQKAVVKYATQGSLFGSRSGQCQKWVATVYQKALGGSYKSICCAHNGWMTWGVSTSQVNIPIGATVYSRGSGSSGSCHKLLGHVGIYIGDGMVVSNTGIWKKQTLASFAKSGWFGWGWNGGVSLA